MLNRRPCGRAMGPDGGMATLTTVMVLFFIMALVAAYANRNLLIEQRVATNSYRAERAVTAAESGVEWVIALLNRGRVDIACNPSSNAADSTPRDRYFGRGQDGVLEPTKVAGKVLGPSCALSGGQAACACPTATVPEPVPHAVQSWPLSTPASAFLAEVTDMSAPNGDTPPGVVMLEVLGCGSPGQGSTGCASSDPFLERPQVDGYTTIRVFLGLVQALPQVPAAALTAGQSVTATALLTVVNTDNATGLTVRSGGSLSAGSTRFSGPAGSSDTGVSSGDAALAALVPSAQDRFRAADRMFRATFGMDAPTYRRQPAVVRIACGAGSCSMADLETAVARYPGLTYWFDGNLDLAAAPAGGSLGTATHPLMVIVQGDLTVNAAMDLSGFLYATRVVWTGSASTATLRGALVAAESFQADVPATIAYDAEVLRTIRLYYGSFVRVPSSWSRPG